MSDELPRVTGFEGMDASQKLFVELVAVCALAGRIVTVPEYMEQIKLVNPKVADVYRYMNFDQIPEFVEVAETVEM